MLAEYASRYRAVLANDIAPFWLKHTLDRKHGGYYNNVDREGKLYDTRKHVWMQARAAWTFSKLYNTFEPRPGYREAATLIFDFVHRHARQGEPRSWFSLTEDGRPVQFQRKPYSAVFVALAMIEYSRLSGDGGLFDEAAELFAGIEKWIVDPSLLGRPGGGYSQLADIMVRTMLASEFGLRSIVEDCHRAVAAHYNPELNLLMENAGAPAGSPESRLVCAGSSLEVAWFLLGTNPSPALAAQLLDSVLGALEFGWDKEYGGLYYFQDSEGRPPTALESNMKLWWPHTEAINALVAAALRTGRREYFEWLERVDAYAFATFADPAFGEWFGYCDRRGEVATPMKGGAYKCFFHLPRCLLFNAQAIAAPSPPSP